MFPTQQDVSSSTIHRDDMFFLNHGARLLSCGIFHCSFSGHGYPFQWRLKHQTRFTAQSSAFFEWSRYQNSNLKTPQETPTGRVSQPSNQTKLPGTVFFSGKTTKAATDHSADTKAAVQSLKKHWPDRPSRYHLKPLAVRQ